MQWKSVSGEEEEEEWDTQDQNQKKKKKKDSKGKENVVLDARTLGSVYKCLPQGVYVCMTVVFFLFFFFRG
jgi:hypothetical protein